ncbi:sugar kinase [Streptomyces sp. uw30]|uniref:sugar kinase n=1 Tax=Streptomyces sp. uw30 TaxID=1828179 RepID=UPI0011CE9498|nr:sugar kinase [Streptomyces sp. uw30]TXS53183.1 sugar kinase [Streptomyces sp. uw30]
MTLTGPCNAPDGVDVVALGESMVTFLPSRPGRLADVPSFERGIGGAESNVVCGLAAAGHAVRWVSRVGVDGFGDHLVEAIGGYGVDVSAVRRDPARQTGVYFRTAGDRATDAHEVAYYRAGSAASAMSAANVDLGAVRSGRVLHLSGITAALSRGCLELMRELTAPGEGRPLVSFDVNHRPGLWRRDADGPSVLLELARACDVVFVGTDEAEAAWGVSGGAEAIRVLLPEPGLLVVKDGARGATLFEGTATGTRSHSSAEPRAIVPPRAAPVPQKGGTPQAPGRATHSRPASTPGTSQPTVFVPAPSVKVAAATGAGDAFAAGFLSATLRDLPLRDRLRHGHLWAAATLTAPGDLAAPPTRDTADRLAALDDAGWEKLRLGPGWTQATERAAEEVRTP